MNTLKPYWEPFTLSLVALCGEEQNTSNSETNVEHYRIYDPNDVEIRFQVIDWDFTPPNDFIGELKTTLFEIMGLGGTEEWVNLVQGEGGSFSSENLVIKSDQACGAIKFKAARLLPKIKALDFGSVVKTQENNRESIKRDAQRRSFIFRNKRESQAIKRLDKISIEFEALKIKLNMGDKEDSKSSSSESITSQSSIISTNSSRSVGISLSSSSSLRSLA